MCVYVCVCVRMLMVEVCVCIQHDLSMPSTLHATPDGTHVVCPSGAQLPLSVKMWPHTCSTLPVSNCWPTLHTVAFAWASSGHGAMSYI